MPDTQEVMFVSESLALTCTSTDPGKWGYLYGDDEDLIILDKISCDKLYQVIKVRKVGIDKEVKRSDG